VVTRHVLQPGWNWEEHDKPEIGSASCELYHRGVVLSGRMGIRTDEGEELIVGPNHVFDLPPGHVTWVEGDEELVMVDWAGGSGFDAGRVAIRRDTEDGADGGSRVLGRGGGWGAQMYGADSRLGGLGWLGSAVGSGQIWPGDCTAVGSPRAPSNRAWRQSIDRARPLIPNRVNGPGWRQSRLLRWYRTGWVAWGGPD
jgi:hypothetical protein